MIEIPGFRVIKPLGQGGMASVFLAEQVSLERHVALKVMSAKLADDPTFTTRFLREARIAARLSHPNIITVHEVGVHGEQHYICMEHHDGGDLKERIAEGLTADAAVLIARDIVGALAFAHDAGFIHRDVKPANVLFRGDGSAVLMDFGIAKATDSEHKLTQVGSILGTPYYISPEQVSAREPDARSDLYSAGIMLFEMLTGQVPYTGETAVSIMFAHVSRPVPQLPAEFGRYQFVIDGLLAKEPSDRYQSGHEVARDLDSLLPNDRTGVRTSIRTRTASQLAAVPTAAGGTTAGSTRRAPSDRPITQPTPAPTVNVRRDYDGDDDGLTLTVGDRTSADPGLTARATTHHDAETMLAPDDLTHGAGLTAARATTVDVEARRAPDDEQLERTIAVGAAGPAASASPAAARRAGGLVQDLETVGPSEDRSETPTRLKTEFAGTDGRVVKGRFKLARQLGKGGMGTVYRAIDLLKQEAGDKEPFVAIKLLNDNISTMPNALRIMQRETKQSQELSHPNIIKVYDFDRDESGSLYMTMELLEGKPLDTAIATGETDKLSLTDRCKVIEEMSAGLAYAHKRGVVHCDFKPGNVFLLDGASAKVLDFGIARVVQGAASASSGDTLFGYTPRYASAEIMQMAPAHPADDVYALAAVAYELLSGKHPFDGRNIVEAERQGMKPAKLPNLKRHQWDAIVRGLAFQKEQRLQSAQLFLEEFHGKPNWALYGGIAAMLAVVIGAGAWYGGLASSDPEDDIAPELRAEAATLAQGAAEQLAAHHASAAPFAFERAIEGFRGALDKNPYNDTALGALEAEAKQLIARTPATEMDKQNLRAQLEGLLLIEKVPLRAELEQKLGSLDGA